MLSKGKYIIIQILLMLVSPLASFIVSLRFYKSWISQVFMIIFAFYFGMHFYLADDISFHYTRMRMYYCNNSFAQILINPEALGNGLDYYHIILKYVISRFTDSREMFAAVNCSLYTGMFLFFFNQFREFYKKFLPVSCGIILLCVVFIVEFYWYQGVRFWIGVFYFGGFYLRYINTERKIYLLLSVGCVLFHYTLINIIAIFILNMILSKMWVWIRVLLLVCSFFYRIISVDFMGWVIKNVPGLDLGKRTTMTMHESMQRYARDFRDEANVFYYYRSEILIFFGAIIMLIFWSRKVQFTKKYIQIFFFAMTVYTVANFAYAELVFFDRFLKMAVLFFYSFLFITACQNYEKFKGVSLIIMIFSFIPMLYSILTAIVAMRAHLSYSELWFGNFFMDWSGGMSTRHGKWFVE